MSKKLKPTSFRTEIMHLLYESHQFDMSADEDEAQFLKCCDAEYSNFDMAFRYREKKKLFS